METPLHFESITKGLWARFVTQLLAGWILSYFATAFTLSLFGLMLLHPLIFPIAYLLVFIGITWMTFSEIPLRWDNIVTIDFTSKTLKIFPKNQAHQQRAILDFDGRVISFSNIDAYSTKNYESPIFSSYFLVTLIVKGEKVKCISFKSANGFTEFITILSKKVGIKME